MTPLFELTGVGHRYPSGTKALTDISLTIQPGEHIGLVGESGAGKSTLLGILLGLEFPTEGTVMADDRALTRSRPRLRIHRRFVQPVFQDPYSSLDPRQRIDRIVSEPLTSLGIARGEEAQRRVAEALTSVGLEPDAATRYPHQFSGGQRQRIAIARAVITNPRVLLADEPVSALDLATRVTVINLLARLAQPSEATPDGITIVLVSHDLSIVAELCHRTVVLDGGRIVEQAATTDILTRPQHPYTQRLLASVPRLPS